MRGFFEGSSTIRNQPRADRSLQADFTQRSARTTALQRRNRVRGSAGNVLTIMTMIFSYRSAYFTSNEVIVGNLAAEKCSARTTWSEEIFPAH